MVLFSIIASLLFFFIEGWPLIKRRQWKDFTVVSSILGMAILLTVSHHFGIPSPLKYLEEWLNPIGRAVLKH